MEIENSDNLKLANTNKKNPNSNFVLIQLEFGFFILKLWIGFLKLPSPNA